RVTTRLILSPLPRAVLLPLLPLGSRADPLQIGQERRDRGVDPLHRGIAVLSQVFEELDPVSETRKEPGRILMKCPGLCDHVLDVATQPGIGLIEMAADRKSTRLNSSHVSISYAVFCLKKKNRILRYR